MNTTPKPRPCAYEKCRREFLPARPMQAVCGPLCAKRLVKAKEDAKKAAEKAQTKARRMALETLPQLKKVAQTAFNAWIRARDAKQPCISCGAPHPDLSQLHAGRDAGHYRSIGSAAHLRYHPDNCHAQCVKCNQWGAGRAVDYRLGLIQRIGLRRVEDLEAANEVWKYTRDELRGIAATYRAKLKLLKEKGQ